MSINVVTVSGRVSRPLKRIRGEDGYLYIFPLAVRERERLVFPIVVLSDPPPFVTYHEGKKLHEQPLVTVTGRICTRNVTRPLAGELAALVQRAGATQDLIAAIRDTLAELDLPVRRVVTEIIAQSVYEGGVW